VQIKKIVRQLTDYLFNLHKRLGIERVGSETRPRGRSRASTDATLGAFGANERTSQASLPAGRQERGVIRHTFGRTSAMRMARVFITEIKTVIKT